MKHSTILKQISVAVLFSALAVSSVHAQDSGESLLDTGASLLDGWSGSANLGANSFTGNTEANNVTAGIRLGKTVGNWEHLLFGSYFKGDSTSLVEAEDENGLPITQTVDGQEVQVFRQEKGENSDRLAVGYQPRFYWRPRTYFFGIVDYEKDKPGNLESSTRQLIGVGHKIYSNASGFLSAEAGVGNKSTQLVIGQDQNGGTAYLGANYLNRFNDNVTFNADARADIGSDNTYTEIGLGLAFKLSQRMAVKLSHQTRANSDIRNETLESPSSSDGATTVNLVVDL